MEMDDLFARVLQHAAETTREKGDFLDRLTWLHQIPHIGNVALVGSTLTGAQLGLYELGSTIPTSAFVMAGATAIGVAARHPAARKRQQEIHASDIENIELLYEVFGGDSVEIYRFQKEDEANNVSETSIHLIWEPLHDKAEDPGRLSQAMSRLADAARVAQVETIAIPKSALLATTEPAPDVPLMSRKTWFLKVKDLSIYDVHNDLNDNYTLYGFTPEELKAYAERTHTEEMSSLDAFMSLLKRVQPRHQSIKIHTDEIAQNPARLQRLEHSLRKSIESKLEEVDMVRIHDGGLTTTKQKEYLHGVMSKGSVRHPEGSIKWMTTQGTYNGTSEGLLDYYHTSVKELETLPQVWRQRRRSLQTTNLIELGAWMAARDLLSSHKTPVLQPRLQVQADLLSFSPPKESLPVRGLQRRLADRVLLRRPPADAHGKAGISLGQLSVEHRLRSKSSKRFVATIAAGMVAVFAANHIPSSVAQDTLKPSKTIENVADKASSAPFHKLGELMARLNNEQYGSTDDKDNSNSPADGIDAQGIGNIHSSEGAGDKPTWYIESYNGMSSEGYWPVETNAILDQDANDDLRWSAYNLFDDSLSSELGDMSAAQISDFLQQNRLPDVNNINKTQPHLLVRGLSNSGAFYSFSDNNDKGVYVVPVPVLEGARIIAADLNGIPLSTRILGNGTTLLLAPADDIDNAENASAADEVQYVLAPGSATTIRAIGMVVNSMGKRLDPVAKPWQSVPIPKATSGYTRVKAEERYIKDTFTYKLAPLPDHTALGSPETFSNTVLKMKAANCNVANTLLTVANPYILNYVSGYFNTNTDKQVKENGMYLSVSEGHGWAVDREGDTYDATPTKGVSDKDASYFKEGSSKHFSDHDKNKGRSDTLKNGVPLAFMVAGVGMLLYRRRQRIAQMALGFRAERFPKTTDHESRAAYAMLNETLYGRPDTALDDHAAARIKQRTRSTVVDDKADAWQGFVRKHDAKAVRATVKEKLKHPDTSLASRRLLRQALFLHRYYQTQ